ncbi:hypothetical protein TH61_17610 [Rufibacter sp. DG15C]|nr:hypothetical protein TH61_17610 [Rufibacter sp. DG15C]
MPYQAVGSLWRCLSILNLNSYLTKNTTTMAKGKSPVKDTSKKTPTKSLKEKRAEKQQKRDSKRD